MQFKNILAASCLALGAAATSASNSTDIAPSVFKRLAQLDLGYKQTYLQLEHLQHSTANVSADDVIMTYNSTVSNEARDGNMGQPSKPLSDSTQLVLCQAFHSLVLSGIELNEGFVDAANYFMNAQRVQLQGLFQKVNKETTTFTKMVAVEALPYCLDTIKIDDAAVYKSLQAAVKALKPQSSQ